MGLIHFNLHHHYFMNKLPLLFLLLFVFILEGCGQRGPITLHARFDDETATAADRRETVEIITKRFANFLHGKHSIAYDSVSGTVTFTLPRLKDTAVYVSLITSVGSLAFMETYMFPEVGMEFFGMVEAMSEDEEISNILSAADTSYKSLFAVMAPNVYPNGDFIRDPVFGRSLSTDTAMISGILNDSAALAYMGQNIIFRWFYDPDEQHLGADRHQAGSGLQSCNQRHDASDFYGKGFSWRLLHQRDAASAIPQDLVETHEGEHREESCRGDGRQGAGLSDGQ
jgi:predicted small lipoprotein YifL